MRNENWVEELYKYLEDSKHITFAWGQNDCCLWACDFVDKITGSNIAANWRGLYNDEKSAKKLLKERGYSSFMELADVLLQRIKKDTARRGDIVLHKTDALGICEGRLSWFLAPEGMISELTTDCKRGWRV